MIGMLEVENLVLDSHQLHELVVHQLHHRLTWCQALVDFLPKGFFPHRTDEGLDHRQGDIGFEQRDPHFAQRLADALLRQSALAAQLLYGPGKALGQILKHELLRKQTASQSIDTHSNPPGISQVL